MWRVGFCYWLTNRVHTVSWRSPHFRPFWIFIRSNFVLHFYSSRVDEERKSFAHSYFRIQTHFVICILDQIWYQGISEQLVGNTWKVLSDIRRPETGRRIGYSLISAELQELRLAVVALLNNWQSWEFQKWWLHILSKTKHFRYFQIRTQLGGENIGSRQACWASQR